MSVILSRQDLCCFFVLVEARIWRVIIESTSLIGLKV
uniref:Uncharacterized protein n=1 Tax=Arundo donax TaxID=35708 RepID=A0A0A9B777_ARUDO